MALKTDLLVGLMEEHSELQSEIVKLCNLFVEDVGERMKTLDVQYLTGLKKFFSTYLEIIDSTEPTSCATPKLSSLLHTYFSNTQKSLSISKHCYGSCQLTTRAYLVKINGL